MSAIHTIIFCLCFMTFVYSDVTQKKISTIDSAVDETIHNNASITRSNDSSGHRNALQYFSFQGQYKNLPVYHKVDTYSKYNNDEKKVKKGLFYILNRIRLSPEINIPGLLFAHFDYDNELIGGNYLKSDQFNAEMSIPTYNDFILLSKDIYYTDDLLYRMKLHRAYVKVVLDKFTIVAGRQLIRFGSGRLWNPLDILNPLSPTCIEGIEEQKGTDAVRVEYYLNDKTEFSLVVDPKRNRNRSLTKINSQNCNVLGRARGVVGNTEIALLCGRVTKRTVLGTDVSSTLFDGLLRGALLYSRPEKKTASVQASAGFEYNFFGRIYSLVEYYFNQYGLNFNEDIRNAYYDFMTNGNNENNYHFIANQTITNNQHYAGMVLGYNFTPLLRGETFAIYDFQGRGFFINPMLKYNAFENIDLLIGLSKGFIIPHASYSSDFDFVKNHGMYYASLQWTI
jgi:hypothetical protein